jgi:hypothetical protein
MGVSGVRKDGANLADGGDAVAELEAAELRLRLVVALIGG